MKTLFLSAGFFIFGFIQFSFSQSGDDWKLGTNSAGYLTFKNTLVEKHLKVKGVNSGIAVEKEEGVGGGRILVVRIPVKSFDSGSPGREDYVAKVLGGTKFPEMVFRSKARTKSEWKDLLKSPKFSIAGELTVSGKPYSLAFECRIDAKTETVRGVHVGNYGAFGLQAPSVGPGGVIAKAEDYLELHVALAASSFPID